MSVIPERKDFKKVSPDVASSYPVKLKEHGYQLVSTVRSSEKSHFDRYGLVKSGKRVVVVYDVKAQMLSVTAFDEHIKEVCSVLDAVTKGINQAQKSLNSAKSGAPDNKIQQSERPTKPQKEQAKPQSTKPQKEQVKPQATKPQKEQVKPQANKNEKEVKAEATAVKGDFTLKKYTRERFDSVLESLKSKKVKAKQKQTKGSNNGEKVVKYELSEGASRLTVCYTEDKGILQIQGKPGDFMSKIQTVFSESGDFRTTVNAHIEQKKSQDKASDVERRLKKYLPTGVLFLSSQAKIDFSIGIIDLLGSDTVLSDYSSLLIPPYRGLEMLIFDLQKAQGIKVKMIGQAFEKNASGEYTLKASYRKRIGSVIFNEVMSALYVEYNSTRNFYVHSALGSGTKVISDKNQAKAIYENMLAVVEYNAKKLKEIGFSI